MLTSTSQGTLGQFGASYADISNLISNAPGLIDKIVSIATQAGPYLDTVQSIVDDPALPRFVDRIKQVRALPSTSSAGAPGPKQPGVGLDNFIAPLDWYIWIRKHPALTWAIGVGSVLAFTGLGFTAGYLVKRRACRKGPALGQRRRRRRG